MFFFCICFLALVLVKLLEGEEASFDFCMFSLCSFLVFAILCFCSFVFSCVFALVVFDLFLFFALFCFACFDFFFFC